MSEQPTPERVKAEADALEAMKPRVRAHSAFGDDHRAAIDAQVTVLRLGLSSGMIEDRFSPDETADDYVDGQGLNVLEAALRARDWLDGEDLDQEPPVAPGEHQTLTADWESLIVG